MATFVSKVKDELIKHFTKSERCQAAELSAIVMLAPGNVRFDSEKGIYIYAENQRTDKNVFTEKHKTFNINGSVVLTESGLRRIKDPESRRAFLRGAFLAGGTLSDPEKSYHLEINADQDWQAGIIADFMKGFDLNPKVMIRRDRPVVYIKEATEIVDMLNIMGAHVALMELENIRIVKEMRGTVNRQVNCETANIRKTITASQRQIEDIDLLEKRIGFESMDPGIREMCRVRREYPDVSLEELGKLMKPPLGKSGVNHRLRKISEMAEEIRKHI